MRPTAPRPVPRMFHQLSLHRIRVHVLQFLPPFLLAPHIEVVKSPLPKMRFRCLTSSERQRQLCAARSSSLLQQRPRDFLFQYLQNLRRILFCRLAQRQMYMLRHHHIPDQPELVPSANFIQDFHKPVPRPNRSKQRSPPITTEGNEMKIPLPVMPLERIAHPTKPAPLNPKGAAPR
jgi:hypothetical protein